MSGPRPAAVLRRIAWPRSDRGPGGAAEWPEPSTIAWDDVLRVYGAGLRGREDCCVGGVELDAAAPVGGTLRLRLDALRDGAAATPADEDAVRGVVVAVWARRVVTLGV